MTGHRIELEQLVQARPERVWEVLTDVEHADQTLRGVERVEMLTEGPYDVGTTWRETRRMFGKEATEQLKVTAVEPPARTVVEADSGGVHYVTEFTLTPTSSDATRLTMTFAAAQADPGPLHKVMWLLFGRLGMKATRKIMVQDLQDIAAAAQRT
ncbi:SRPBCC family protein [Nocardioides sp. GCM10027113]|uniref:SRPBCC family protein n=1 Tax=unclassified Nocardioides TaxID=2615069 RepID=UPI003621602B